MSLYCVPIVLDAPLPKILPSLEIGREGASQRFGCSTAAFVLGVLPFAEPKQFIAGLATRSLDLGEFVYRADRNSPGASIGKATLRDVGFAACHTRDQQPEAGKLLIP